MTAFQQKKMQRMLEIFPSKCKETDLKRTAVDYGLNLTTDYAQ